MQVSNITQKLTCVEETGSWASQKHSNGRESPYRSSAPSRLYFSPSPLSLCCLQPNWLTKRRRLVVYMCQRLHVYLWGLSLTWKTKSDWVQREMDTHTRVCNNKVPKPESYPKTRNEQKKKPKCCTSMLKKQTNKQDYNQGIYNWSPE